MNILYLVCCLAGVLYVTVLAAFYVMQEKLMFAPKISAQAQLQERGLSLGYRVWQAKDGSAIGWHRAGRSDLPPVLVLHGTGGDAFGTRHLADVFPESEGYLLEYPGFGSRPGAPSLLGQVQTAIDALDAIGRPVFLAGYSMGTGIATAVASRRPGLVKGLLLLAAFDRLSNIVTHRYPFLPSFVMKYDLDSTKALEKIDVPVAIVLAGKDEEVPAKFGVQLYDKYLGPKKLWVIPDAGHQGLDIAPPCQTGSAAARYLMHSTESDRGASLSVPN